MPKVFVKSFVGESVDELEIVINSWVRFASHEIIDVKFQFNGGNFYALVMYK